MRNHFWPHTSSTYLRILWSLPFLLKLASRTFSIYVSDAPDLANLLPLLPNLETLEVYAGDRSDPYFGVSFEAVNLPQVRVLIIDVWTHFLMKCCTNFKRVVIQRRQLHFTYRESISFVADSLVHLALCCPAPHHIRGGHVSCTIFGVIRVNEQRWFHYARISKNLALSRSVDSRSPWYLSYTLRRDTGRQHHTRRLYQRCAGIQETSPPRGRISPLPYLPLSAAARLGITNEQARHNRPRRNQWTHKGIQNDLFRSFLSFDG